MVIVSERSLLSGAETLAENLRKLFDEKISLGIESIKITASFGVVAYVEGLSVDGIADNAESFLLKAKASGGDKVVCFPSRVNG